MKKIMTAIAAGALTLSMAACNTPGERAVGGAAIGGIAGAAIGGAAVPWPVQPSVLMVAQWSAQQRHPLVRPAPTALIRTSTATFTAADPRYT